MTIVAWIIERKLIKALKKGGMEPAPRTAGDDVIPPGLTVAPHEVGDQA